MDTNVEARVSVRRGAAIRSRRRWSVQEKVRIVLETLEAGVSVPVVARRHCVNANELFIWRGQYRRGELGTNENGDRAVKLLPVQVEPPALPKSEVSAPDESATGTTGCMEIQISGGRCHRPAYWSQVVIGMWEPGEDRRNGAMA